MVKLVYLHDLILVAGEPDLCKYLREHISETFPTNSLSTFASFTGMRSEETLKQERGLYFRPPASIGLSNAFSCDDEEPYLRIPNCRS